MPYRYLDWAASAPPYDDIIAESCRLSANHYGNPASHHQPGNQARTILDASRVHLARTLDTKPAAIHFTSGGTEADHIIMLSVLLRKAPAGIIISGIEHAAVYEQARMLGKLGVPVQIVPPDADGFIRADAVAGRMDEHTALVSIMAVNNETGAIQPLADIAKAVNEACAKRRPVLLHSDAVQALGKTTFTLKQCGFAAASISGHKIGAPRGIGALLLEAPLAVLAAGGGQENAIRPGTPNIAGAWALAEAASRSVQTFTEQHGQARLLESRLIDGLLSIPDVMILPASRTAGDNRFSPNIISATFPGLGGETMTRLLDDAGFAVATGSACSSAHKERRILDAMGLARELSFSAIRISTGRSTTCDDIDAFLDRASALYQRYRT